MGIQKPDMPGFQTGDTCSVLQLVWLYNAFQKQDIKVRLSNGTYVSGFLMVVFWIPPTIRIFLYDGH